MQQDPSIAASRKSSRANPNDPDDSAALSDDNDITQMSPSTTLEQRLNDQLSKC